MVVLWNILHLGNTIYHLLVNRVNVCAETLNDSHHWGMNILV
jgi:hypothetical protein